MRVMLHHDADHDCPLVCFGQVVSGDPFVLVGRTPKPDFHFADLAHSAHRPGPRIGFAVDVQNPWITMKAYPRGAGVDPYPIDPPPAASVGGHAPAPHRQTCT